MIGVLATARRTAQQLLHDRRSLVMILVLPSMLMWLTKYVFDGQPDVYDRVGPMLLGLFPFVIMFVLTFGTVGLVQAAVTSVLAVGVLGLLASAFARTEFQAVQFMPLIVIPQILLGGLLAPRESMAAPLTRISDVLPLSYATDALGRSGTVAGWTGDHTADLVIVLGFTTAAVALAGLTLRRRTA